MKNIIQSIIYGFIGLSIFGWFSVFIAILSISDPGPDSYIVGFFSENIMSSEKIENLGFDNFAEISSSFFTTLFFHMNLTLIIITASTTIGWCIISHFLNIDAPGKAKIYAIHWLIISAIFIGLVFGITWYFTASTTYPAAEGITTSGQWLLIFMSLLIYVVPYYLGVLLGTARFARSSVLLANKLPGGF